MAFLPFTLLAKPGALDPAFEQSGIVVSAESIKEKIVMLVIDMYGRVIETKNVSANSMILFRDRYRGGIFCKNHAGQRT